jgi:hypothetical protein
VRSADFLEKLPTRDHSTMHMSAIVWMVAFEATWISATRTDAIAIVFLRSVSGRVLPEADCLIALFSVLYHHLLIYLFLIRIYLLYMSHSLCQF